ncbi:MAG TPA: Tic22 family protein [Leptolyngbyaceae cyanobacterium]
MKKLFRSLAVSSLATVALTGAGWVFPRIAQALPEEQIVGKLQPVPVFLIVNAQGQPLTAAATANEQEVKVPVVFLDSQAAESFLGRAREQDSNAKIALVDLGTLFQEAESAEGSSAPPPLMYFPDEQELAAATSIQNDFRGVPLFFARKGADGPYLTITQNGQSSLPMFFSRADLQTLLDRYSQENPADAGQISVEVLSLEWLLAAMSSTGDNELDAQLSQIRLFPSSEVLQFLRSQQEQAAPNGTSPAPANGAQQ